MVKKGYQKLIVWQKADELAYQIYLTTENFPKKEQYGLTSQIRRAAVSVPTNITEGMGRQGRKELKHFVNISLGSLAEVEYLLSFCSRLGILNHNDFIRLESLRNEVGALLWKFFIGIR